MTSTKKQGKTTIYTLSEKAGVSPSTVSKALNNSPDVSMEVRERVARLARELMYRPRVTKTRVPNICALIQRYDNDPFEFFSYLTKVLEGISDYVQQEHLEMSIFIAEADELNRSDLVREFGRRNVDGVIILQSTERSLFYDALEEHFFPYYSMFTNDNRRQQRLLAINNEGIAFNAVRHLTDLGHKRVAMLSNPARFTRRIQRLEGYKRAMRAAGLPFDENLVRMAGSEQIKESLKFGRDATVELLREHPDVTAIFAVSHTLALGALQGLYRLGLQCPKDVSMVSCDDFTETEFLSPPLTVVRIPYRQLGFIAAQQVHRMIRGLPELDLESLINQEGEVIVRESSCPPRNVSVAEVGKGRKRVERVAS